MLIYVAHLQGNRLRKSRHESSMFLGSYTTVSIFSNNPTIKGSHAGLPKITLQDLH